MNARRRWLMRAVQLVLVGVALWFAVDRIARHWDDFRRTAGSARPDLLPLVASVAAVLALYAVQIHAWRVLVAAWDTRLPFAAAARIWCLSNLARFLPASPLFTTGTMGLLASRAGVSPVAAAGSALLGTLLNLGTGCVVVVLTGAGLLHALVPRVPPEVGPVLAIVGGLGLLALPLAIAPLARIASRLLRRPISLPPIPVSALAVAVTANLAAWFLYGVALRWLALAFFPHSGSNLLAYIAVFTAAYLAGFVALLVPAGLIVREGILLAALPAAHLMSSVEAAVVVVASRLVLTLLEAAPGAVFLALDASRSRSPS